MHINPNLLLVRRRDTGKRSKLPPPYKIQTKQAESQDALLCDGRRPRKLRHTPSVPTVLYHKHSLRSPPDLARAEPGEGLVGTHTG